MPVAIAISVKIAGTPMLNMADQKCVVRLDNLQSQINVNFFMHCKKRVSRVWGLAGVFFFARRKSFGSLIPEIVRETLSDAAAIA